MPANVLSWAGFTLTGMAAVAPALTAADLEPLGSSEACNERGLKWLKQGRSNLAVADFEAALKLDPKFARAYHNLSMVYRERDELDRALEYANQAVALDPNAAHCRHRALLFRLRADYDKSLADLDKAVAADDKDVNILLERAFVQRTLGHLEEAAADCDRALKLEPASVYGLTERAYVSRRRKGLPGRPARPRRHPAAEPQARAACW